MGVQINGSTGAVTGTQSDWSGNVSIGGTLTYEDVTNIDAVGLITARTGIEFGARPGVAASISADGNMIMSGITTLSSTKVGTGITLSVDGDVYATGVITATSFKGDGSALTGIDATQIATLNTSVQTSDTGSNGTVKVNTDGTERLRVTSSGDVLIGGLLSDRGPALTVETNTYDGIGIFRNSADQSTPLFTLAKSRGTSAGAVTAVNSGDKVGRIRFQGADGDELSDAAYIDCEIDGTTGNNDMPGRLIFFLSADGSNTPTERLRINSSGNANFVGFVTATQFVTPNDTGSLSARNKIDNGAMEISQRGGAEVTVNSTSNVYLLDRWVARSESGDAFLMDQDSSAPYGFKNSLKINCSTASSGGASEIHTVTQNIEGHNIADFGFGGGSSRDIAVSFWVKSSLTGDFGFALQNSAQNRSYAVVYNIASANSWQYVTKVIPGPTSGSWNNSNTIGLRLTFDLGCGSNFRGNANAWNSADDRGPSGAVSMMQTQNSTWYVTGVQVEMGPASTPFEYRGYPQELLRCQRYYYKDTNTYGNAGWSYSMAGLDMPITQTVKFPTNMRSTPSVTQTNTNFRDNSNNVISPNINSLTPYGHWYGIKKQGGGDLRMGFTFDNFVYNSEI